MYCEGPRQAQPVDKQGSALAKNEEQVREDKRQREGNLSCRHRNTGELEDSLKLNLYISVPYFFSAHNELIGTAFGLTIQYI